MSELLIKSQNEILDDILRTLQSGMDDAGKVVDISQGSDYYILAQAITNEINIANQNVVAAADNSMPDTAQGEDLDRLLQVYGVEPRKAAQPAKGYIVVRSTQSVTIPTNAELTASNGTICKVLYGGFYANGSEVELITTSTGESANLVVNDKLTWSSPPAYINPISLVSVNFVGGADAEDYEAARQRLYAKLQSPATDYNWSHVAKICEDADSIIQKAYVYSAANGPSTMHIALTRNAIPSTRYRSITPLQLSNANLIIQELMPEYVETIITTVAEEMHDVSFKLNIPYPSGSTNVNSYGGGWVDQNPYPLPVVAAGYAYISNVTSSTKFQVTSSYTTLPVANRTQISWLNTSTFKIETAYVIATSIITNGPTNYVVEVTINKPFVGAAVDDFIMPAMVNGQSYIDTVLDEYNKLGPGEKTNSAGVLPRAYRKPKPNISNPYSLDGFCLRNLITAFPEINSADFLYQSSTSPTLPASINDAPSIFIPRKIAFYPY